MIRLLPALLSAWREGDVKGPRARGGCQVDIAWQDSRVTAYRIAGPREGSVVVRVNGQVEQAHAVRLADELR
ncbi:MAG: hypothetical protein KF688_15650 [Pirellulales bacterium]|nr:hypothetical protein [Pirellulales bacterium]